MGITIKELAEISGYSVATISRVISGSGKVKIETRKAIEKLLIDYNYRTNIMEIRNTSRNQNKIMIIVGDLDNWYYMQIIRNLNIYLWEQNFIPIIVYSNNQKEQEEEYVRIGLVEKYAGLVFLNVRGDVNLKKTLENNGCPVVFLNRAIKHTSFDTVCNDNYHGGYKATEYLINRGHKKIGHLMGSLHSATAIERRRGFEDAMYDHELVITENSILYGDTDYQSGHACGEKIIKKSLDFTALFCGSYQMMEGLLDVFAHYNIHIPDNFSVICFDETPSMKRANITTVCAEAEKMAKMAIDLLLARMNDRNKDAVHVNLETKLIERTSVKRLK